MGDSIPHQPPLPSEATNRSVEVKHELGRRDERPRFVFQAHVRLDAQGIGQGHDVRNHFAPFPAHAQHPPFALTLFQLEAPQHFAHARVVAIDRPTAVEELHAFAQTPPLKQARLERFPPADRAAEDCHDPEIVCVGVLSVRPRFTTLLLSNVVVVIREYTETHATPALARLGPGR